MTRYEPDLSTDLNSPFIRDDANKLVRHSYWLDMDDRTLMMVMVSGVGSHLEMTKSALTSLTCVVNTLSTKCASRRFPPERYLNTGIPPTDNRGGAIGGSTNQLRFSSRSCVGVPNGIETVDNSGRSNL